MQAINGPRLRARPDWRGWNEDKLAEHQRFAAWPRPRIRPAFDTGLLTVEETADRVAGWVMALLPSP